MLDMFAEPRRKELRPYQIDAINLLKKSILAGNRRVVLALPTGGGKCLGLGTPIIMADGSIKPVEDVEVGDRLASPTGEPVTVLSLARGRERMFRVTPVKGDTWTCNASHLLSVKVTGSGCRTYFADGQFADGNKGQVITIRADDLHKSSVTARHISKQWRPTAVHFEGGEALAMPAYALGVWLGDGTSMRPDVSKPFGAVSDAWSEYAESVGCSIRVSYGSTGCPTFHASTVRGQANPILDLLRDLDVLGNKHIPASYKAASLENRRRLLAGIFDTDGYSNKSGIDFISKHKVFAEDVVFVCRSVGLSAYVRECTKGIARTGFSGTYWRVSVSGDCTTLPVRRLKIAHREQIKDHLVTGFTLEEIGEGDYYGFEVTGDRLFLLGDFTVTHNTLLASKIVEGALAKGGRVVFCAPMISLINQTIAEFEKEGIHDIGAIQASHPRTDPTARVQVASVQTLVRREVKPEASVVLVDEAHVYSLAIAEWMARSPETVFIGLSATPGRAGMSSEWQDLVVGATTRQLIDAGFLSQFTVYAPSTPDLSGVKIVAGEYQAKGAAAAMEGSGLVGDILQNYILHGENRPTLGFAVNVAHAKRMAEEFTQAGIPSAFVEARTDMLEREAIRAQFEAGRLRVIWSVRTMTTGVDLPVSGIIDAAPTRSEMLHQQKIGRGLRINPGTEDLKVWDHAGNTLRLGFVDQLDWSALKTGVRGEAEADRKEPLPKPCPACAFLMEPKIKACPNCGAERKTPSGFVETQDGELVAINREVGKAEATMAEKSDWYSQLLGFAVERQYNPNWAANKYREKFGVWPRGVKGSNKAPGPLVRAWIKSRQIAYAKSMEAKNAG